MISKIKVKENLFLHGIIIWDSDLKNSNKALIEYLPNNREVRNKRLFRKNLKRFILYSCKSENLYVSPVYEITDYYKDPLSPEIEYFSDFEYKILYDKLTLSQKRRLKDYIK